MNIITRILKKLGLLQYAKVSDREAKQFFDVAPGEVVTGRIESSRDVMVRGSVVGDISSPDAIVEIASGGLMHSGTIKAQTLVWDGRLGDCTVECEVLHISKDARSSKGHTEPTIYYSEVHFAGAMKASVRLIEKDDAAYQDSLASEEQKPEFALSSSDLDLGGNRAQTTARQGLKIVAESA